MSFFLYFVTFLVHTPKTTRKDTVHTYQFFGHILKMDLKSAEKMCTIIKNQFLTYNEIMMPYQQPLDHVTQILDHREKRILVKAYFCTDQFR